MPYKLLPYLLVLSLITCCIEVDISAPSFPEMSFYFDINEGKTQLTLVTNFLGFCLASLFYGPLAEIYGRRKIMIIGNAILTLAAFGCALTNCFTTLLWFRFFQGIGASASAVIAFTMIADAVPQKQSVQIIARMNAIITITMTLAPVIGSFVSNIYSWRGNYTLVAFISLLSWVLLVMFLPETRSYRLNLNVGDVKNWYSKLLSSPRFLIAAVIPSLLYSAYMVFVGSSAFTYINTYKLSLFAYAFHQAMIVCCFALASTQVSRITSVYGTKACIKIGMALSTSSITVILLMSGIGLDSSYLTTTFMSFFVIGFAISYPIIFSASLEIFPEIKGIASSVIMTIRMLLCSGLLAIASVYCTSYFFNVALLIFIISCCTLMLSSFFKTSPARK